jgi:hypothetical protein
MRPIAVFAVLWLLLCLPAEARVVGDVDIPDRISLIDEKNPLVLNGAGYRKKFFIKVYIGALYLAQPTTQAKTILDARAARVMRLHFLREVGQEQLASAWNDAIAPNLTASEMQALRARIDQLNSYIGSVRNGDVLRIEMPVRADTGIWINDRLRGSIPGADFQTALLKAWLGEKPADANLKRAVLGDKE